MGTVTIPRTDYLQLSLSLLTFIPTFVPVWFHVVRPNQDEMIQIKIPVINTGSPYLLTG